jgi:hypothetical protein
MPCTAPPPIVVEATFTVNTASPLHPKHFHARGLSANYIDRAGNFDFTCFKHPIVVVLTIGTPGIYFYGQGNDSLSFADDAANKREQARLARKDHQFPGGVQHVGRKTIWFVYRNDWDCGAGDGARRCPVSAYGFYVVNDHGVVSHVDPIIQNGGDIY